MPDARRSDAIERDGKHVMVEGNRRLAALKALGCPERRPNRGLDQSGNYKIDARFNRTGLIERIRTLALYSDQISVTCGDGINIIKRYRDRERTFIYADPSYFEKAGSLYLNAFNADDHEGLAQVLNDGPQGHWLLTYDDVPQVHQLYQARRRRTFELHYSAHRVKRATEIAVLSDAIADIGDGWPS